MSVAQSKHLKPGGRPISHIAYDIMHMVDPADDRTPPVSFYDSLRYFQTKYPQNDPVVQKHLQPLLDRYRKDAVSLRNGLWYIRWHLPITRAERLALTRARSIVEAAATVIDFHADNALNHGDYGANVRHRNRAHCFRQELPKLFEELAREMQIPLEKNNFSLGRAA